MILLPKLFFPDIVSIVESADRAVFIELYDKPSQDNSLRKLMPSITVAEI